MNFLSAFLNLLRILVFSALFFGCRFASQSPPLSDESVVGYTYKVSKFCFRLRRVAMIIIFHFYFLLIFILGAKKSLIKTTTDLKGQKIRTNLNTLKAFFSVRIYSPNYEVVRVQHLKICTTKQTYRQTRFLTLARLLEKLVRLSKPFTNYQ